MTITISVASTFVTDKFAFWRSATESPAALKIRCEGLPLKTLRRNGKSPHVLGHV